ncbi:rhomboid family intramembrane serine protease [Leptospira semungkisensis]|uniref:Rhomboid family intramembrane serine protease n=1 Tax=Leptospira semungkisensis TaxID=2484985 RepID=A0A4R9FM01_9LEPT|nr:rhomboid family intramembrane serine protease [Leptospira semungkisensis]TGJ99617.1 rhomboid family intramembrane serine protease [Leptospira semungkisensis]
MAKRNPITGPKLFGFSLIHPLNLVLLFNIFVWVLLMLEGGRGIITYYFGLNPSLVVEKGMYWQVFTYGFLHVVGEDLFSSLMHIGMNMFGLYTVGFWVCRYIGAWKFLGIYLLSQLGGGIFVVLFSYIGWTTGLVPEHSIWDSYHSSTVGASGGVFGVLAAFSILFPEARFAFPPVRAKFAPWLLIGIGFAFDSYSLLQFYKTGGSSQSIFGMMSNSGHLGGAVFGLFSLLGLRKIWGEGKSPLFVRRWEEKEISEEPKPQQKTGDPFEAQIRKNRELLSKLYGISDAKEKEDVLAPIQSENANLCPPGDYNPEDMFCLRCEWLQNCELRKLKRSLPES